MLKHESGNVDTHEPEMYCWPILEWSRRGPEWKSTQVEETPVHLPETDVSLQPVEL